MSNKLKSKTDPSQEPQPQAGASSKEKATVSREPMVYQIRIKDHLGRQWTDWGGGLIITLEDDGATQH